MKRIVVILSLFFIACSNNVSQKEANHESQHEQHDTVVDKLPSALQLNNGAKWKTDEATRSNVAAMVNVINDSSYISIRNRAQLTKQLQVRIDTLVQQCKMKGPDHDALHVWLEQILYDLTKVKEGGNDYQNTYAKLKKDMERFYAFFE